MLLGPLEENLISLLCFSDEQAKIIRNAIGIECWGGPFRVIAQRAYDYIDRFGVPPKQHLPDILSDKLVSDTRESQLYTNIIDSINGLYPEINVQYVMGSQLEPFIKRQYLRSVQAEFTKALQRDTEESINEAEAMFRKASTQRLSVFDPGIRLSDKTRALGFLDSVNESFPTGIKEFDKRGFGPTRKELWLGIGNIKGGKSWLLMHLAKTALMNKLKVSHITLEMSEARCAQRYFQSLFVVAKRLESYPTTRFKRDELGRVTNFDDVTISPKLTLDDKTIHEKLEKIIDKWSLRLLKNIFIKQFPTGRLTVNQLEAYLDNLEATQKFTPDLLIVDYPDLMKQGSDPRLSLDETYKNLRGLAIERNLALAVVSQSNRAGASAKVVSSQNVAEAYTKTAHADCVTTISQTSAEKMLKLARLTVTSGRNDEDGIQVVISQQFGLGNFVVDSALLFKDYWKMLPNEEGGENGTT